jgi:5-formyltetrahydrofolate cyclo-ligase
MNKKMLRKKIIDQLKSLSYTERELRSRQIIEQVKTSEVWLKAKRIALYHAFGSEVHTVPLIEAALSTGKEVYLPLSNPLDKSLSFYRMIDLASLKKQSYGIFEPTDTSMPLDLDALDLMVVPGVLFDYNGYRIGYGGGYYDRFFAQAPQLGGLKMALLFELQVSESPIPSEPHDLPVQLLVTEERWIYCDQDDNNQHIKALNGGEAT